MVAIEIAKPNNFEGLATLAGQTLRGARNLHECSRSIGVIILFRIIDVSDEDGVGGKVEADGGDIRGRRGTARTSGRANGVSATPTRIIMQIQMQ